MQKLLQTLLTTKSFLHHSINQGRVRHAGCGSQWHDIFLLSIEFTHVYRLGLRVS